MRVVSYAAATALISAAALMPGATAPPEASLSRTGDLTSAPDGERIGVLLPGAEVRVLERRGEWVRVSLEGWVLWPEGPQASQATAPPGAAPPGPAPTGTAPGARLAGAVFVSVEGGRAVVGSGVVVRLLRPPEQATGALEAISGECEARRAELRAEAERLEGQAGRALKTIESTTLAFDTYDEAKRAKARALKALREHDKRCGERAEEALESLTAARGLTDGQGRYLLEGPAPGRYLLRATLEAEGLRHVWELTLDVTPGQQITLDLTNTNRSRVEPTLDYR